MIDDIADKLAQGDVTSAAINRDLARLSKMHFRKRFQDWSCGFATIAANKHGVEQALGLILYALSLISLTQWRHICCGRGSDRSVDTFTEWYVFGTLLISVLIFIFLPNLALLSTYFSATTVIILLNIVLLQPVLGGEIVSPQRSLLLFVCNVIQIVVMFATWYSLGGEMEPLLTSVLTFATIGYSVKMPKTAITQIATNFVLVAVYLSHLMGRYGR
jgi:hypothetical protein